jgi:PAS domain S-box-containing protein
MVFDRDTTEGKSAEMALQASEERFRMLADNISGGITIVENGSVVYANDRACEIFGCSRDEYVTFSSLDFAAPEEQDRLSLIIERARGCGDYPHKLEFWIARKDGTRRYVQNLYSQFNADGVIRHFIGTVDITDRKRADDALRDSEERIRAVSELISDSAYSVQVRPDGAVTVEWITDAVVRTTGFAIEDLLARDRTPSLVHPDDAEVVREHRERLLSGKEDVAEFRILARSGDVRWLRSYGRPQHENNHLRIHGVLADITEQMQAVQTLGQRVDERTHELMTLLDVSHDVASTLELEPLLKLILDQLKSVVDWSSAGVLIVEEDDLIVMDYRGLSPREEVLRLRLPLNGVGPDQEVIRLQRPIILDDIRTGDARFGLQPGRLRERPYTTFGDVRSWMGIPMIVKGQPIGMFEIGCFIPSYYRPEHARLAMAIADYAAVAIENARLYEHAQEAAALRERQHLAQALHDSVSQALYGIQLGAQTARESFETDPASAIESLDYVLKLAGAGLAEMRAVILDLRPELLERKGLVAAVQKKIEAMRVLYRLDVSADFCCDPESPPELRDTVYGVAQEALHNVVKHARAQHAHLTLKCNEEHVILEVRDDGIGFDAQASYPGHLGLQSMSERVARVGGVFHIESAPGCGTRVLARIPIRACRGV